MKNKNRLLTIIAVLFVVYSVISFALPFNRTPVFWLSYAFGAVAVVVQIYVMKAAFANGNSLKSKFYGFPIANVGMLYMAVQIVLSLAIMALASTAPIWIPLVLDVVLLGAAIVGFFAVDTMREEVERQDVQMKKDTSVIRGLQMKVASISAMCEGDAKVEVDKLAEALRYSDPVSSDALAAIEAKLEGCVSVLQQAAVNGDNAEVRKLCGETGMALAERNLLCQQNKR